MGLRQESPVRLPGGALALDGVADVSLAPVFSPDGAYVAAPRLSENYLRTSVWRVTDGSLVGEVAGYASDVAFLPDGSPPRGASRRAEIRANSAASAASSCR